MVLTKSSDLQIAFAKDIDIYRTADQYIYLIIVASISLLRCQSKTIRLPHQIFHAILTLPCPT